ncbi:cytochrome P450 [Lophiostoma macrostomum CBS 122681]|uniref:Cytochrome P450 n=1 Tax=Lophiostoma macrostomum CBS 122681 TaxID=1314788 RepID=A0A6A6SME3_9PLEO|nr:cytochrome P450 [Lophiostoma macrostomum CBS 122681]
MMASFTFSIILCSCMLYATYKLATFIAYKATLRRHGCLEPPSYRHLEPVFGLDLFLGYMKAFKSGNFLDFNKKMFDQNGKTFQAKLFGKRIIRTIDPEVSKAVHATFATKFGLQPLRYKTAKHLWGNGIIVVDGEHWKHGRALMKPSFDVVHLANFERLKKHTKRFIALLPKDGETVDLMPLFKRLILDTSSEFIFGEAMGGLEESASSEHFMEAFSYAQRGTAIRAMLGHFKFLHRNKKWWQACQVVTEYLDTCVQAALDRQQNKQLRVLSGDISALDGARLRLVDEMAKDSQNRITLRSHILSVFSPAHDGAAVTLSNAIFHLARHPEAWDMLRKEMEPTRNESLSYELSVVLPFGGGPFGKDPLYVRKDDIIEINYRSMCRDADFWGDDADRFVPERWEYIRPNWEYTPFGGGPRSCLGMRLVYTETAYVLVEFLRTFARVENRDPDIEWKEEMRMTFQSKNGCIVGLIPR